MLLRPLPGLVGTRNGLKSRDLRTAVGLSGRTFCPLSTFPEKSDGKKAEDQLYWDRAVEKLTDFGFSGKQSHSILLGHPGVAGYSTEQLQHKLAVVQSLGFKMEEVKEMATTEPRILSLESRIVKKNHSHMLKQLGDHHGRVAVQSTPLTLVESCLTTARKIDYCLAEIGLQKSAIARSKILQCSFELVRTRHAFLSRSGFYRRIDPKNIDGVENNPSIVDVFFLSDEAFVAKYKPLTIEEYVIFEAMISQDEANDEGDSDNEDLNEETPKFKKGAKKAQ